MIYDRVRQYEVRAELQELMPLFEVKRLLNISWYRMMQIVKAGDLPVYNVSQEPLRPEDLNHDTRGLRCLPTDVKAYIQKIKI